MTDEKMFSGTLLTVDLDHKPTKAFWLEANNAKLESACDLETKLRTIRIDADKAGQPKSIEIELILQMAQFREVEALNYFGVTIASRTFRSTQTVQQSPIHLLLSLDMSRLSPTQFSGLDLVNGPYDLEEVVAAVTLGWDGSPFREIESWQCTNVQMDPTYEVKP